MKNKGALIISAVVTAALITVGIGVIHNVNANNNQTVATATATTAQLSDREQAYQQLLADANAKISLANQQIEELVNQLPTETSATVEPYLFSSQQAAALAANIAGVAPQALPELVNFNNTPAYEAVYANGKIYIDANTGRILYNGLQAKVTSVTPEQALNIAMRYLNRSDAISIDVAPLNGTNVYVIGFADGTRVYVSVSGQVVAIEMPTQSTSPTGSDDHEENDD